MPAFNDLLFISPADVCDPQFVVCGRNAICTSQNHQAVCECPEDMVGDPNDLIQGCQRKNFLLHKYFNQNSMLHYTVIKMKILFGFLLDLHNAI